MVFSCKRSSKVRSSIFSLKAQLQGFPKESDYEVNRITLPGCCKWLRYGTIYTKKITKKNATQGNREVAHRLDSIKEHINNAIAEDNMEVK